MQTLNGLDDLNTYFRGVTARLAHHGVHWRAVVGTLAIELLARVDANQPLRVRTYNGKLVNQITLTLRSGRDVRVTYHSGDQTITIDDRSNSTQLAKFAHDDDPDDVAAVIRRL